MKNPIISTLSIALLATIGFSATVSASAADITAQREARTAEIEALYYEVRSGRMERSDRIQALLDIARLEAEDRKQRRQEDRIRDRQAALSRH